MKELTENMMVVLKKVGQTAHYEGHNGSVVGALIRRGLLAHQPFKGLVLTQRGYYIWLFLESELDEEQLCSLLEKASDE